MLTDYSSVEKQFYTTALTHEGDSLIRISRLGDMKMRRGRRRGGMLTFSKIVLYTVEILMLKKQPHLHKDIYYNMNIQEPIIVNFLGDFTFSQ